MSEAAAAEAVVRAAGGIVLRASATGGWEVAIVHRPEQDDWTLPKGKLLAGEEAQDGALREVKEETGLDCTIGRFAGQVRYTDRRGRPKMVDYWLMQPSNGAFVPSAEVDQMRWVTLQDSASVLSYRFDRELLASVTNGTTPRVSTDEQLTSG